MAKSSKKTGKGKGGVELVQFRDFIFEVTPNKIQSFQQWTITGQADTEEKETDKQKYVSLKGRGVAQMELTAVLNYFAGADVQKTVLDMVEAANAGAEGYVYFTGKKLFTYKMMLVKAEAKTIQIAANGLMTYAEVSLSFRQSTKKNGKTDTEGGDDKPQGGGGGRKYTIVVMYGTRTVTTTQYAKSEQEAVTKAVGSGYNGYVLINGTRHYIHNGKIDDGYKPEDATKPQDEGKGEEDPPPSGKEEQESWRPGPKKPPLGKGPGPKVTPEAE